MIDWDNIRYFLAVARGGSVRAAAHGLGVNHATVLRRIAQLEGRLGTQMFEKLPLGYRLTEAGEEALEFAKQMEASSHQLETRVLGRDQSVRGLLRVTLAPTLTTHLLMPDIADFTRLHPDIEIEILSSGELANLTNREADVAIRVVYDRKALPPNLHGLKGPELFGGVYMSRNRLAAWRTSSTDPIRWIVITMDGVPDWARTSGGSDHRGSVQDHGRRSADRCGTARARDLDPAVLRWGRRPIAGEGARYRLTHVRNTLAAHTRGGTQDQARTALHGVHIPQARGLRATSRGAVHIARLMCSKKQDGQSASAAH